LIEALSDPVSFSNGSLQDKRPLDSRYPVGCMDESPKQLIAETRAFIPVSPGQPAKHDYEYPNGSLRDRRCGVCNIFLACEPLAGKRMVTVTERKTKRDWACFSAGSLRDWKRLPVNMKALKK